MSDKVNPLSVQEGGSHYKNYKIQPVEFAMANNLNLCQSNVVKYVVRYKDKGGLEDLKKARHYIDLLIYYEYGEFADAPEESRDELFRGEGPTQGPPEESYSSGPEVTQWKVPGAGC